MTPFTKYFSYTHGERPYLKLFTGFSFSGCYSIFWHTIERGFSRFHLEWWCIKILEKNVANLDKIDVRNMRKLKSTLIWAKNVFTLTEFILVNRISQFASDPGCGLLLKVSSKTLYIEGHPNHKYIYFDWLSLDIMVQITFVCHCRPVLHHTKVVQVIPLGWLNEICSGYHLGRNLPPSGVYSITWGALPHLANKLYPDGNLQNILNNPSSVIDYP